MLFLGVFLLSFVAAAEPSFRVKEFGPFDLKVSCENQGDFCSTGAYCNLTTSYPNSTILVDNKFMTNLNNGYFNYALAGSQNSPTGLYTARATCTDGIYSATTTFTYEVTPTGDDRENTFTLFLILLIVSALIFVGGYFLDSDWMIFFGGILWILTGMYGMIYGIGSLANLYTRAISGIFIAMGLVFILASIFNISQSEGGGED